MLPDPDSFHLVSWSRCLSGQDGAASIGQVICSSAWHDGTPVQFDSRNAAKRQIERLAGHGLALYSAPWSWSGASSSSRRRTWQSTPGTRAAWIPTAASWRTSTSLCCWTFTRPCSLPACALRRCTPSLAAAEMEVTMAPKWGICGPDEGFPLSGHCQADRRANAFFDAAQERKMSAVMRHWLRRPDPPLGRHRRAYLADGELLSPIAPAVHDDGADFADWAVQSRNATFRVKLGSDANRGGSYIENRMPSSAANAYIVTAATLAAGWTVWSGSRDAGRLPSSMEEALAALEGRHGDAAGARPQLIEFYVTLKRQFDLGLVQASMPTSDDAKKLAWERAQYLENL
uniref:Lengsin n=1 Tax=Macrostomum lignano TaxID=282301 RepID=A0A1I8FJ25_9PLAT